VAREVQRSFDAAAGAVVVVIEDELGARSVHTIYALDPAGQPVDVEAAVRARIAEAATRAARLRAAFARAGWRGPGTGSAGGGQP
jgi:hypothetical protein